jgi:hypothetical protein
MAERFFKITTDKVACAKVSPDIEDTDGGASGSTRSRKSNRRVTL